MMKMKMIRRMMDAKQVSVMLQVIQPALLVYSFFVFFLTAAYGSRFGTMYSS